MSGQPLVINSTLSIPLSEIAFRTSRSGGPGGQNVNKLETKVEALFDVAHSPALTEFQRKTVLENLKGRIDSSGILRVMAQQSRSQYRNKQLALDQLVHVLRRSLKTNKPRMQSKPTRASNERRMQAKRRHGEKKRLRKSALE